MKKIILTAFCMIMLTSCTMTENEKTVYPDKLTAKNISVIQKVSNEVNEEKDDEYQPLNYEIQKGIWISYIDLAPMLYGADEKTFCKNFETACRNVKNLGFNTVYVQVRPFGDALYDSELFQRSRYLSDEQDFDPLVIMTETAHKYKLSFHGWINPLRCETEEKISECHGGYMIEKWYKKMDSSDIIGRVAGDEHLWLNPAYEEVRKLISDGAKEIVEKYDVDGIHYDDYFYPTTEKSFDSRCYAEMSENESLEDWRLGNISQMCSEIYSAVKSVNTDIKVGISPQGNIQNNYDYMYADVKKWGSEKGYADYIVPQIYFGYENQTMPFIKTLESWKKIVSNDDISLVAGLGAYKIMSEYEFSDNKGIISQQISDSIDKYNCKGASVYSYGSLFTPAEEYMERIKDENVLIRKVFTSENK